MTVAEDEWKLVAYEVHATGGGEPKVSVTLDRAGEKVSKSTTGGDGPLDALFRTIEEITGTSVVVRDFRVHSVTRGKDAQGESTIEVERDGRVYRGRGVSTDTVEAATLAFLNAVNRAAAGAGSRRWGRGRIWCEACRRECVEGAKGESRWTETREASFGDTCAYFTNATQ